MEMKILGQPNDKFEYEFMVLIPITENEFKWHSNHENSKAYEVAKEVGGVVVHNLRVSKKKLKRS